MTPDHRWHAQTGAQIGVLLEPQSEFGLYPYIAFAEIQASFSIFYFL